MVVRAESRKSDAGQTPFFGVLLVIALGLLTVAGVTEIVYRRTRSDLPVRTNSWL